MWRILIIICVLFMIIGTTLALGDDYAEASDNATVTLTVYAIAQGIIDFTTTPVGHTQLDFSWSYGLSAVSIMIRGKYENYPNDIPDLNIEPSDGFLIYSGNATSASYYFDENLSTMYIKAWGQREDGTWFTSADTGAKGGTMELMFFLLLPLGMTYISSRSSYYLFRFLAGGTWFGFMAYWLTNRPTSITAGSAVDTIIIILLIGIGLAVMFMTSWTTRTVDGVERGTFNVRLPQFLGGQTEEEEIAERQRTAMTSRARRDSYRERANAALRGRRTR